MKIKLSERLRPFRLNPIAPVVGLLSALVLLLHARSYLPLVYDDSLISLRYAKRLLQGHGLTWTDGEVVEGVYPGRAIRSGD